MSSDIVGTERARHAAAVGLSALIEAGSVLEATPECLVVAHADGRIVFANRHVETLTTVDSMRALSILAEVIAQTGDVDRALALYEAAADQLEGHEHEAMLIDVYRRWSDLLAQTGDTQAALDIARRAIMTRQPIAG